MSKVDWSKAPEGAEFYAGEAFCKSVDGLIYCHGNSSKRWLLSDANIHYLKTLGDYEERPQEPTTEKADNVRKPSHYQLIDGVESIEIIARSMTHEQWKGFCLGNMLKYRIRAGKKDALQQDIDKANYYGELYELHKGKCYDSNN
jgi:hypothetical protein